MKINWDALAAIGTISAVIWALYSQGIKEYIGRPNIDVSWFEPSGTHLLLRKGASYEKKGDYIYRKEYDGVFITIQLKNTGERTAKDTEIQLTKVGKKSESGAWIIENSWIPIPLRWVLGGNFVNRNLIPERPYLVNLASFSSARDGQVLIDYVMSPKSQRETFEPGEYCFEISIYAIGLKKITRYILFKFDDFKGKKDPGIIQTYIKNVDMKSRAPWNN